MTDQTFEKSIQDLEQTVKELEAGDLPLEDALKKFEEGVKLSKFCSAKLDEADKKVTILLQDQDGNVTEKSFLDENDPSDL